VLNVFIIYVVEELRGRGYKGYIVGLTGNVIEADPGESVGWDSARLATYT
jgi:hypothetical protein